VPAEPSLDASFGSPARFVTHNIIWRRRRHIPTTPFRSTASWLRAQDQLYMAAGSGRSVRVLIVGIMADQLSLAAI
jgi:hypothetical protein